jgi:anti-sigma regulatory factor (Ser/Thr protein kinase)
MKTNTLLKEACQIVNLLEHHSEDDYTNYRIEELFRNVTKHDGSSNDETRDITIRIMEHLIEKLAWDKTDQQEDEWYPFDLQDEIHDIINEALEVKNEN